MSRTKRDEVKAKSAGDTYVPMEWRQISGFCPVQDAERILTLKTREQRIRELARLKDLWGKEHAYDVEIHTQRLWRERGGN